MFIDTQANLLRRLIEAEDSGQPLTLMQLGIAVRTPGFEDLWARELINIRGQEGRLCCTAHQNSMFVVSPSGREWLADHDRRKCTT